MKWRAAKLILKIVSKNSFGPVMWKKQHELLLLPSPVHSDIKLGRRCNSWNYWADYVVMDIRPGTRNNLGLAPVVKRKMGIQRNRMTIIFGIPTLFSLDNNIQSWKIPAKACIILFSDSGFPCLPDKWVGIPKSFLMFFTLFPMEHRNQEFLFKK